MKQRFWLFKRGTTFYLQDSATGEQKSLGTKDRGEAQRLLELKRQSSENPAFKQMLLKTCLSCGDRSLLTRTWQTVMDQMVMRGEESTRARCARAFESKWLRQIAKVKLIETTATEFLAVLNSCPCSINHYLRRLHNLALGLGWLPFPILPSKLWPTPRFGEKRAITRSEHEQILAAEKNRERNLYYQLLWHIGAAQSDAASLESSNIHWTENVISFRRKKTGTWSHILIGKALAALLRELPTTGALFPEIGAQSANDRAAEFSRRCKLLKIEGISLHSYRYSWAERAKAAGYPERFAQEALGHSSRAVHQAYARNGRVVVPPLEDFEREARALRKNRESALTSPAEVPQASVAQRTTVERNK